mgnify:CR=1 FL=1
MTQFFANATASHFAQAACAAFPCTENSMIIILDASILLLASILICLLGKENSFISRITAHPTVSSLDLRGR